jgi:hypothetical protein
VLRADDLRLEEGSELSVFFRKPHDRQVPAHSSIGQVHMLQTKQVNNHDPTCSSPKGAALAMKKAANVHVKPPVLDSPGSYCAAHPESNYPHTTKPYSNLSLSQSAARKQKPFQHSLSFRKQFPFHIINLVFYSMWASIH